MTTAGLILAAGASRRLGQPKQLVSYRGTTLLNHAINTMAAAGVSDITCVLGCAHERIAPTIAHPDVRVVINDQWQNGMGATLSMGTRAATEGRAVDLLLVMLCDQPFLAVDHLQDLFQSSQQHKKIACSRYHQINGVPAVFPRSYFSELTALKGDQGARRVLAENGHDLIVLDCPDCEFDLDTEEDLKKIQ